MEKQMPEMKPLDPIDMHAPIEVHIKIYATPDGKTVSLMQAIMPPGRYPSIEQMRAMVGTALTPEQEAQGGRLLLKPEFIAHITKRELGTALPMAGDQHFVPAPCEIPHKMLVHAICGAGVPFDMGKEYLARGLAIDTLNDSRYDDAFTWDAAALDKQPGDVLLALYERITK